MNRRLASVESMQGNFNALVEFRGDSWDKIQHMQSRFVMSMAGVALFALGQTAAWTQQPASLPRPTLRSVDVYGTDRFSGADNAAQFKSDIDTIAASFAPWPPNDSLAGDPIQRIERALKSRGRFVHFNLGITYGPPPDNGLYIMIDVVEQQDAARRMPFRKEPTATLPDPAGLISKWKEYQAKVFKLMFAGTPLVVSRCPVLHCIAPFEIPELAPYLPLFNEGATTHETQLYEIVKRDRDGEQRAAALFLLVHTNNAARLLPVLTLAIHDVDAGVRNNAMRILIPMAQTNPKLNYPVKDLIAALDFPSADDRNKSASVLEALVKSPDHRATINKDAVPSLLRLLRLGQANNHDPAYSILKALSGETFSDRDYAAWEKWAATRQVR